MVKAPVTSRCMQTEVQVPLSFAFFAFIGGSMYFPVSHAINLKRAFVRK